MGRYERRREEKRLRIVFFTAIISLLAAVVNLIATIVDKAGK